ncbi:LAME_0C02476g1_1 [Lachancea meyersii CBS 8951]|uniref:LAME_0C02476g1_1 n=1 Tax=Lachancea meyersii CBS 8951 TaxID=1266667 RepID=A0A1G4IZY1_9SACH|nr:LAME_0C02476g1_1 [Lachancea meyersii CBS 8951]
MSSSIESHSGRKGVSAEVAEISSNEDVDVALNYLRKAQAEDVVLSDKLTDDSTREGESNENRTYFGTHTLEPRVLRKVDCYILPFLCLTYLFMFLDKVLLNYAASMGIKKHLKGNEFSNLGTIFSAAYIFAEPFVTFCIQRWPVSKVMGTLITLWGIVLACHSACKSYASLMVVRTLLGMFESSSAVGCIAISGMYYTKSEQSARIGFWATQAGTGYIVGGLISFGFLHYSGTAFTSWQIMFLVVGLVTVAFGIATFLYLPDNVTNAWFLTETEKVEVLRHIRANQTGHENKKFKVSQIKELFLHDKFTYPMLLITACSQISTGAIGTFSVTITQTFGFDKYQSALLQLPIGTITAIIILVTTQMLARFGQFTLITTSMYIPAIIGCVVMLALPLSHKIGNLFALYLLYSGSCVITNIYIWNSCNTSGYSKRVFRNAATMIVYSVACIVAPQMFRASSYPRYVPAKIALLVTQAVCVPLQLYVGWLCRKENRAREIEQEGQEKTEYQFLDYTDIENRSFRYFY